MLGGPVSYKLQMSKSVFKYLIWLKRNCGRDLFALPVVVRIAINTEKVVSFHFFGDQITNSKYILLHVSSFFFIHNLKIDT